MRPVATDIARHDPQQKLSVRCRCQQQQQQQPTARMGLAMEACGCQTLHNKHQGQASLFHHRGLGRRPTQCRNQVPHTVRGLEFTRNQRSRARTELNQNRPIWEQRGQDGRGAGERVWGWRAEAEGEGTIRGIMTASDQAAVKGLSGKLLFFTPSPGSIGELTGTWGHGQ